MANLTEIISQIGAFLAPINPYVVLVITFVLPIYIQLGEIFAGLSDAFLSFLPSNSYIMAFIIMGVFIALGIFVGIISEKKFAEEK
ncbi:hypothetical protein [Candidatus Lokiarchaeum ossiferum]|uniref:hypothetical protein n=1 Tax=Candidatus Lokiarchaeum ossiferum TaxID=2951803 RepID=UPI00352E58C3